MLSDNRKDVIHNHKYKPVAEYYFLFCSVQNLRIKFCPELVEGLDPSTMLGIK